MKSRATSPPSATDWARLDRLDDGAIDLSDLPEVSPEAFARALVRKGLQPVRPKRQLSLRLDAEVVEWFKASGRGYQSQMNAVLKAYKEACEKG